MQDLIKNIHDSMYYGEFIEIGCGQPIAQLLYSVSGASKTIYFSESPYSKDYFSEKYGNVKRAVSKEATELIIKKYEKSKCNFTLATSFQVGNYNDISTHGWISINDRDVTKSFHISIHDSLSREEYIKLIGEIGIKIIHSYINNLNYDCTYIDDFGDDTIDIFCNKTDGDNIIVVDDGKIKRLEDIFRDKKEIIIYKGSFNPPQMAHVKLANYSINKYPNAGMAFMININTYEKGTVDSAEIKRRISYINKLGYPVLIHKNGYFSSASQFIRKKFKQPIVFPMGYDTAKRLLDTYNKNEFDNCIFLYMQRNNSQDLSLPEFIKADIQQIDISSTVIRESIKTKNYDIINQYLPFIITEQILNDYNFF